MQNFIFDHIADTFYRPVTNFISGSAINMNDPASKSVDFQLDGATAAPAMSFYAYKRSTCLSDYVHRVVSCAGNYASSSGEPVVFVFRCELPKGFSQVAPPSEFIAQAVNFQAFPIVAHNGLHTASWNQSVQLIANISNPATHEFYYGVLVILGATEATGIFSLFGSARLVDVDIPVFQPNK